MYSRTSLIRWSLERIILWVLKLRLLFVFVKLIVWLLIFITVLDWSNDWFLPTSCSIKCLTETDCLCFFSFFLRVCKADIRFVRFFRRKPWKSSSCVSFLLHYLCLSCIHSFFHVQNMTCWFMMISKTVLFSWILVLITDIDGILLMRILVINSQVSTSFHIGQ